MASFPAHLPALTGLAYTRRSIRKIRNLFSGSGPIAKLPVEILVMIFEAYAESCPEVRDRGPADLCLVNKYWNAVASDTPRLWSKIIISFPNPHLDAVLRRIHGSTPGKLDVVIYIRQPGWDCDTSKYNEDYPIEVTNESIWAEVTMGLLRDTEERWRSIKVVSQIWLPLYKFMQGWTFTHLPSLESISMERENPVFATQSQVFYPKALIGPMTLFGRNTSLPKLRDLSLSAVHVDWDNALVSYQNLRKLELKNLTFDTGPSFGQFRSMLSSSPRLEYLNVSGFCPEPKGNPEIPVVYLPALRDFTFGWKNQLRGCKLLQMFQIGSSLENLTLMDARRDYVATRPVLEREGLVRDSSEIFKALHDLGKGTSPGQFICMRGVRSLRIIWAQSTYCSLVPLIMMLVDLENVWLEDVGRSVLEDVASVLVERGQVRQQLRLTLRWTWRNTVPGFAKPLIRRLKDARIDVTTQAGKV